MGSLILQTFKSIIKKPKENSQPFIIMMLVVGIFLCLLALNNLMAIKRHLKNNVIVDHLATERTRTQIKARLMALDHNLPKFQTLATFLVSDKRQAQDLSEYVLYYKKLTEIFPNMADTHGLLGFCYFYMNEPRKALRSFKIAATLNPDFFYFQYNLGILYHFLGDYQKAEAAFTKAIATDHIKTMNTLLNSKILQRAGIAQAHKRPIPYKMRGHSVSYDFFEKVTIRF